MREPVTVGVKVTVTVHVALAASVEPHVVPVIVKSPRFAPPRDGALEMVRVVVPVFVSVELCGGLVLPSEIVPNARVVGENEAPGPLPVVKVCDWLEVAPETSVVSAVIVCDPPLRLLVLIVA